MVRFRSPKDRAAKVGIIRYETERIYNFLKKVSTKKTKNGCILWKGKLNKMGYGIQIRDLQGKRILPHRFAYLLYFGNLPDDLFVCHKCDNPTCVNPKHLWLGTHQDNMRDKIGKHKGFRMNKKILNSIIKKLRAGISGYEISKTSSVSLQTIYRIRWKYVD